MNEDAGPNDDSAVWAVKTVGPDLYRYALRRTASKEDADDVIASVFETVWERRQKLPLDRVALRMWCFGVAKNKLREHVRGIHRQRNLDNAVADATRGGDALHTNDPEDIAETADEVQRVRRALAQLDHKSRELVTLVHWDGLSITEAARLSKMNPSTARTRYWRARKRLGKILAVNESVPSQQFGARVSRHGMEARGSS